jgi:tetratricopeptide (TPR) repeat protein
VKALPAVSVAVLLSGVTALASAQLDAARAHVNAAFAYFDDQRYADAVRELQAAYALDPVPELQYNLGQCFERLGHPADASQAYRRYLQASPRTPDRAEVEGRLAALDNVVQHAQPGATPTLPVERVVLKTVVIYREPPPPPGRAARYGSYGATGLAVLATASSVVTGVIAGRKTQAVTAGGNPALPVPYDGSPRTAAQLGQQLWYSCAISAALAVTFVAAAVGLRVEANRVDREAPKVTWGPSIVPSGGGVQVAGRF